VPSGEQVADLIAKRLSSNDCKKGFVLDAFMTDLAGDALHRLTSLNDNVKAVTLSSIGETKSEVPTLDSLKQRGDVYTLDDTGDTDSDATVLGALAANFTAPKQDPGLFG
jgi:hypothetical protein